LVLHQHTSYNGGRKKNVVVLLKHRVKKKFQPYLFDYVGHHRLRLEQLGARWPDELQIRCLGLLEA
jgi:hypothetical protein